MKTLQRQNPELFDKVGKLLGTDARGTIGVAKGLGPKGYRQFLKDLPNVDDFLGQASVGVGVVKGAGSVPIQPGMGNIHEMEPFEGVKEASEYLKSQGVPREYRKQILESFDRRTIKLEIAGDATFGIRFYGGNANAKGRYLFETFTLQTNRQNLALPPEWNSMDEFIQFHDKPGTIMITGDAFSQLDFGSKYIGGANQWYINNLEDLIT